MKQHILSRPPIHEVQRSRDARPGRLSIGEQMNMVAAVAIGNAAETILSQLDTDILTNDQTLPSFGRRVVGRRQFGEPEDRRVLQTARGGDIREFAAGQVTTEDDAPWLIALGKPLKRWPKGEDRSGVSAKVFFPKASRPEHRELEFSITTRGEALVEGVSVEGVLLNQAPKFEKERTYDFDKNEELVRAARRATWVGGLVVAAAETYVGSETSRTLTMPLADVWGGPNRPNLLTYGPDDMLRSLS